MTNLNDDMTMPKIRVALVTGGDSTERPVCFMSAKALSLALPSDRFSVAIFDVASAATRAQNPLLGETVLGKKPRHVIAPVEWGALINTLYTTGFDVVLPALHGGWGEDGTLQALLEVAGIPYVGSKQHTSAIAIDKQTCKAVVGQLGVPTPRGEVLWNLADLEAAPRDSFFFHHPCVVKPNSGGSSLAVTIFRQAPDQSTLSAAIEAALNDGSGALIEEFIEGQEVTASVLGEGESARNLPLIEIVAQGDFYDYDSKYKPGGSQHLTPPRIAEHLQRQIEEYALRAHGLLGCRGVTRSDYMVTRDGKIYFLEINTLPGMTETSLVPDAARAAGIEFEQLVERLVMSALPK